MRLLGPMRKNDVVRVLALFCGLFFAIDALDLQDELLNINNLNSVPDDNVTTGIHSDFSYDSSLTLIYCSDSGEESPLISRLHKVPYSNRAPPARS
jgi:hypothetical protein